MKYTGTKTGVVELPKQLRVDPELKAAVVFISGANCRSIQGQILHWIIEGVEKEEARFRQVSSDSVRSAPAPKSVKVGIRQEKSA